MHLARPTTPRLEPIEKVAVKAREAMKDQPINAVNVTATMAHNRVVSKAVNVFAQTVLFQGELPRRQVELAVLRTGLELPVGLRVRPAHAVRARRRASATTRST